MRRLISLLVLGAGVAACAGAPARNDAGVIAAAPGQDNAIAIAAVDPLEAPPPPTASDPTPAETLLLVPAQSEASLRVPLGTLGSSTTAAAPAAKPPTPLAPRAAASASSPPAQRIASAAAAPAKPAPARTPASAPSAEEFTPAAAEPIPAPPPAAAAAPPSATPAPPSRTITLTVQPGAGTHTTPRGVPASEVERSSAPTPGPAPATAPTGAAAAATPGRPAIAEQETTIISSASAPPATQGREFVPAPVIPVAAPPAPPRLGEMPVTQAERNIARRFETLARLRDEGLITQDEFGRRRAANLGALLPYSQDPPGAGLDRAVPGGDAIVARLGALRRSFEMRAITAQQHALERTMILNALLPENPEQRTGRKPPPEDVIQGAAMVGRLEGLREDGMITQAELDAERKMIDAVLRTGLFPPKGGEASAKPASAKSAAKPASTGAPAASGGAENPLTTEITGPVLHLASFRSEASARQAWQQVLESNKAALATLKPIIRRIDLGEGRGIFYRLMTGSFANMADAEAACVKLKQNNQFCRASADGS